MAEKGHGHAVIVTVDSF